MLQNSSISVIVPSNHAHAELLKVLRALCLQTVKPTEIVIVDSYVGHNTNELELLALCSDSNIKLTYINRTHALPGDARNIGISFTTAQLIAFIDVATIPRPHWLEESLRILSADLFLGVWGSTLFKAETEFEKILRDSFYGASPCQTLPGSIFKREVFEKAGQFVDWVRAGEDSDWMQRVSIHGLPIASSSTALVDYLGLVGMDINKFLKRWYRNYMASRRLPHFSSQKLFLWLVLYPLFILIAFNWNYLVADWRMDSPFYISHITKFAVILPLLLYIFVRGFFIPAQRGVHLSGLLPFRFISIVLVCLLADAVKSLVFTMPHRNYAKK